MIEYQSVEINFDAQGDQQIYQNLKVLYTTPAGTVPLDRAFGIDISLMDEPLPIAQGRLIIEYREKTRVYEPRASVEEVQFEHNPETGKLVPKVVITIDAEA